MYFILNIFLLESEDTDVNISDESNKHLENSGSVYSGDEHNFENTKPVHKSTPMKIKSNVKTHSDDKTKDNEDFNEVSELLMNTTNSYDTLKLFKPKPRGSSGDLGSRDKVT